MLFFLFIYLFLNGTVRSLKNNINKYKNEGLHCHYTGNLEMYCMSFAINVGLNGLLGKKLNRLSKQLLHHHQMH